MPEEARGGEAAGVPIVVAAEMAVDLWKGKAQLAVDRRLGPLDG